MTLLQVMSDSDCDAVRLRTRAVDEIGTELAKRGIRYDRWPVLPASGEGTLPDRVLSNYADQIGELNADGRYRHIDVVGLRPDDNDPGWPQSAGLARDRFLSEHRHAEDEVRFFVSGRGCFYLHLSAEVVAVVCEPGDLLSVPARTPHWFDMGERPDFVAIRFFEEADGWIGDFTGDVIGQRFPTLDELVLA